MRSLPRGAADRVARHLVAAGRLLDEDPAAALAHAVAARSHGARVGAVREAVGIAAYHAGDWHTAVTELRAYQRMTGSPTHLAVVADSERALGRPERAVDIYRSAQRERQTPEEKVELLIVAAGARRDLGQVPAAVAMLQVPELTSDGPWAPRLRYAYADALLAAGRAEEAREWFARAAEADEDATTDAAERLLGLDGVVMDEVDDGDDPDELPDPGDDKSNPTPSGPAPSGPAPSGPGPSDIEPPADPSATPAVEAASPPHPTATGTGALAEAYDLVVLDLDGVVYIGDNPVSGAAETIARLREAGIEVLFATNNASRTPDEVADLLGRHGIPARPVEVLTSAMVAADRLATILPPGSPVLVVGSEALAAEVRRVGLRPLPTAGAESGTDTVAAVVQGYAPEVGWRDLAEACVAIRAGATWVATNTDRTLPSERGPLPGNGALVGAVREAVGRDPDLVAGKPDPAFFEGAASRAGSRRVLVVGDRLDTDVDGAHRAGLDSLLVLTGIATADQVDARLPQTRPTYVAPDLGALLHPPPQSR